ncbi:MAG: AraC family transcriptional regulator [Sedimentisphaerales bacterium]
MAKKKNSGKTIKRKYVRGQPGHILNAEYFYYETEPNYKKELAIVCGGYEKCAPDYQINRNSYPYYVIKYTISGRGTFTIHSKTHQLKAGVLSGFSPRDAHNYQSNSDSPLEHIFIIFTGAKACQLLKQSSIASKNAIEVANPSETLYLLKAIMRMGIEKPPFSQQICRSYLRILLLRQAANIDLSTTDFSQSIETYRRCKKYIDDNFTTISSPADVADNCAVNMRYMARLFQRYGRITPHDYIMRLKLNKAATLLLTSGLSINEIGYSLGFNDPYHFSRVFKKFHGLAPHHYRQMHMASSTIV